MHFDIANFGFTTTAFEEFHLNLLSSEGDGFDSLTLTIGTNSNSTNHTFTDLADAEAFFDGGGLDLGDYRPGSQGIILSYSLTASEAPESFGFNYDLTFTPGQPEPVPEPPTWAMMLIGFAGLGFAGYRRARESRAA